MMSRWLVCVRSPPRGSTNANRTAPKSKASLRMTATDELRLSTSGATERRTFAAAAAAHFVHDGYTDLLYVLLPVWQTEFGLGYAEVGMLRGSYMATMSALQIPSSLLAERVSPIIVLAGGTLLAASCFLLAGASTGVVGLLVALLLGGV